MSYNGYKNYETWAICLWIDNEEDTYLSWKDRAKELLLEARESLLDDANNDEIAKASEDARIRLADELKDHFEEVMPDLGASVWADLLNAALSEVDWHEVASSRYDE
jgi:hypothetical protein